MKLIATYCVASFLALSGCATGEVEVSDICVTKEYPTLPKPTVAQTTVSISRSDTFNFSEAISKVKDFGNVEVSFTSASFSSKEKASLTFIKTLQVVFVRKDGSEEVLNKVYSNNNSDISMLLNSVSPEAIQELQDGPVTLKLIGEGSVPTEQITPVFKICASAKANVDVKLSDAFKK